MSALLTGAIARMLFQFSVVATFALAIGTGRVHGQDPAQEPATARSNQVIERVIGARLRLEEWKLQRLQSLRQRGFASWLEVARQQYLVESIRSRQAAFVAFVAFADRLHRRALLASDQMSRHHAKITTGQTRPIKVYSSDSPRLLGWIEHDAETQPPPRATQPGDLSQTAAAVKKLERAERRFRAFDSDRPQEADWIRHAELLRDLAKAELNLAQVKHGVGTSGPSGTTHPTATPTLEKPHPKQFTELLDAQAHPAFSADAAPGLLAATMRVSACESRNADSKLRAANIEVARQTQRLGAIRQLHASGVAGKRQLDQASTKLVDAQERVDSLKRQKDRMEQAHAALSRLTSATGPTGWPAEANGSLHAVAGQLDPVDPIEHIPLAILADWRVVEHLVELRRDYYYLVSQREALQLKLNLLNECVSKLEESMSPDSGADDYLTSGERTQVESHQLSIAYHQALWQISADTISTLAMEEKRFIRQCVFQFARARTNGKSSDLMRSLSWGPKANYISMRVATLGMLAIPREMNTAANYLESADVTRLHHAGLLRWSRSIPDPYQFVQLPAARMPLLDYGAGMIEAPSSPGLSRKPEISRRTFRRRFGESTAISQLDQPADPARAWSQPSYVGGIPYYSDPYPHAYLYGMLRSELRSELPAGHPQWYYPGSPVNFRYRR